jgi:hypothetical protein
MIKIQIVLNLKDAFFFHAQEAFVTLDLYLHG